MSMEQSVCSLVRRHWGDLHPADPVPDALVCLKVAGKTSPNAAIILLILDEQRRSPVAVAKIPRNPGLAPGLEREYAAMVHIRESLADDRILARIPCRGAMIENHGSKLLLQEARGGHPMVREMTARKSVEMLYERILPWMFDLHAHRAEEGVLEGETLRELVEAPIAEFLERFGNASSEPLPEQVRRYFQALPDKVKGRTIRLCRQHGDFNAHNLLVEYRNGRLEDFTLIDWEDYRPRQLPIHDLNHFFISNSHILGAGIPPEESYAKLVLSDGWYRDLYLKAMADYEVRGLIDRQTFSAITPLYFLRECLRTTNIDREQEATAPVWIKRMNLFIGAM